MTQKHSLTIQAVSIIGGILTAIFFLGFLALAKILRSDISCLIVGSILILTTLTISRMVIRSFLDAMNITLYIAGCVLHFCFRSPTGTCCRDGGKDLVFYLVNQLPDTRS